MLSAKHLSQKNEVLTFYTEMRQPAKARISQTAFFNARSKFNPETLLKILQDLLRKAYTNSTALKSFKGYHVLAIDGSRFLLPQTEEFANIYGTQSYTNNYSPELLEMAFSADSCMFDCLNSLILDFSINNYKTNELIAAQNHLNKIQYILPGYSKTIVVLDRGYAGIRLIDALVQNNMKFVIRLPSHCFKKEQSILNDAKPDQWFDIKYTKLYNYKNEPELYTRLKNTVYSLRIAKINLETDGNANSEYLLTNLDDDFSLSDLKYIYHLRWGIETSYRSLKSQFKVEYFRGLKDIFMRQEIYAAIFVYDIISMIAIENFTLRWKHRKYVYKPNRNYAIGALKHIILLAYLSFRHGKVDPNLIANILAYGIPSREGRSFMRKHLKNNDRYFATIRSPYCMSF
jgi:Transposase DDE domain.